MKPNIQRLALGGVLAATLLATGCGQQKPTVQNRGSTLFAERCGGCHTLTPAATQGSNGQKPTGPNLDYRKEATDQVLFAIRNGGFSGAIMPQNIVVGEDAQAVADFVSKYAGSKANPPPSPGQQQNGSNGSN